MHLMAMQERRGASRLSEIVHADETSLRVQQE